MNGDVWSIGVQPDGRVLMGGTFTEVREISRRWMVRLHPDNTVDESFVPDPGLTGPPGGSVYKLVLLPDQKILAVGDFTWGSEPHRHIVRLESSGKIDPGFDPGKGGVDPWTLALRPDGRILMGGGFDEFNGVRRRKVVQLRSEGQVDPGFDPGTGPDEAVTALLVQPDGRLIVGGLFTNWNGARRPGIVRLNTDGSLDTSFGTGNGIQGVVLSLAQDAEGRILAAGRFLNVDGQSYASLVRLTADGFVDSSFYDRLSLRDAVWKVVALDDGRYLIGGEFTKVQGADRIRIARLRADGRLDGTFIPETGGPDDTVLDIVPTTNGRFYVGGEFRHVGARRTPALVRFGSEGNLDPEFPATIGTDVPAAEIVVSPAGKIWLGGQFSFIHGARRRGLACLHPDGRLDARIDLALSSSSRVTAILADQGEAVIVAGFFDSLPGFGQRTLLRVREDGGVDPSFARNLDGTVAEMARQPDGRIVIAGTFQSVDGVPRPGVARLEADGRLDPEFAPVLIPNNPVVALSPRPDGSVVFGGGFEFINHLHPPYLARYDAKGTADPVFERNLGPSGWVHTVSALPNGRLVLSGRFGFYGERPCGHVIRVHPDGALDEGFPLDLVADGAAYAGVDSGGRILVWGTFNRFAGQERSPLLRLTGDGKIDPEFASAFRRDHFVHAVGQQPDGRLVVAGSFIECDGVERIHLARLFGGGGAPPRIAFDPATLRHDRADGFRARIAGVPGQVLITEATLDLRSWRPLATNTVPASGVLEVRDPEAGAVPGRIYRALAR